METVGKKIADRSVAVRKKYGMYPVRVWDDDKKEMVVVARPEDDPAILPLPGHAGNVIPECPDYTKMKKDAVERLPLNREDVRRRFNKLLPRILRVDTFSRQLNRGRR